MRRATWAEAEEPRASDPNGPLQRVRAHRSSRRPLPSLDVALATEIVFGKFHGRTLGEIAALEPTYLAWVERTITRDPDLVAAARVVLDDWGRHAPAAGSPGDDVLADDEPGEDEPADGETGRFDATGDPDGLDPSQVDLGGLDPTRDSGAVYGPASVGAAALGPDDGNESGDVDRRPREAAARRATG